jgi:hypothetical protein
MATVTIGCKLPLGLILEVGKKQVTINGANKALLPEYGVGFTEVEKEFAEQWFKENQHRECVKQKHIEISKSETEAKAKAKEISLVKTGTERLTKTELEQAQS